MDATEACGIIINGIYLHTNMVIVGMQSIGLFGGRRAGDLL